MAYKEKKLNNKNDVQSLYNALGSMPERKKTTAKQPATKKKTAAKKSGK